MKMWQLLGLGTLLFLPYFIRPDLVGADSYYFLNQSSFSIPEIKIVLLGVFLTCLFFIQKLGQLFGNKYTGWLVNLSPLLLIEALKFENDVFAYPFLIAGLYFFYKWARGEGSWLNIIAGFIAMGLGTVIWKGGLLYIFGITLPFSLGVIPILVYLFPFALIITQLFPNLGVSEGLPFMILGVMLLITGILSLKQGTKMLTYWFLIMGILQNKFLVHVTPFLALGLEDRLVKKFGSVPLWLFFIPFVYWIVIFTMPPTADQWEMVEAGIEAQTPELPLITDWDYGYWAIYLGADVPYYGWIPLEQDFNRNGIMLTREVLDCPRICVKEDCLGEPIKLFKCEGRGG